jgi:hypothetical protein
VAKLVCFLVFDQEVFSLIRNIAWKAIFFFFPFTDREVPPVCTQSASFGPVCQPLQLASCGWEEPQVVLCFSEFLASVQILFISYFIDRNSKQNVFYMKIYQKNVKNMNMTSICLFASCII